LFGYPLTRCYLSFTTFTALLCGRQKHAFGPDHSPICRLQRQTLRPSFLSRCDISRIHMNHIKQQTHSCTGTRTPRSGYWVNITFQVTVASLQANATACSRNWTTINRRDQRHASGYELMCHLFWGPNGAKSATIKQTTQGCAILRTCLSINNDRVPRSLAGSLARSLDLTYCSSRFVKKGQLEYRCKPRISVLVLRVRWALIG
jgi:hypothetical protein